MFEFRLNPLNAQFKIDRYHIHAKNQRTNPVGKIEHGGDRNRVGQPHEADRDWQIATHTQGYNGGYQHLRWQGDKSTEQPYKKCPADGLARQMPEVWIMYMTAQPAKVAIGLKLTLVGHKFFDKFARHQGETIVS